MKLKLKEVVSLIQQEIDWCLGNPDLALTQEYQVGFVSGLRQAKTLIEKADKYKPPVGDYNPSICEHCSGKDWHHTVDCYLGIGRKG